MEDNLYTSLMQLNGGEDKKKVMLYEVKLPCNWGKGQWLLTARVAFSEL